MEFSALWIIIIRIYIINSLNRRIVYSLRYGLFWERSRLAIVLCFIDSAFLIQVESDTQEYEDIQANIQKQWNSKSIPCPSLTLVLAVVNPREDTNFTEYKNMYSIKDKNISSFFLGTDIGCDLYYNHIPCKNASNFSNCRMCHLTSHGLGKLIYHDNPSFSLQKNLVDAHLKVKPDSEMHIYSLLLCDVACGNAKKVRTNNEERPEGADVVVVQQTEEVKVFNADLACIRYILFYIV